MADNLEPKEEASKSRELSFIPETGHAPTRLKVVEGTKRDFGVVFLGQRMGSGGWSGGYQDEAHLSLPEGFDSIVSQASYGYTGISVKAHEGFKVETLVPNEEDPTAPKWQSPRAGSNEMVVSSDWGNLGSIDVYSELWKQENMGNSGLRAGIVRVTSPRGETKYYVIGADFKGRPDNWMVYPKMAEVQFVLPATPTEDRSQLK